MGPMRNSKRMRQEPVSVDWMHLPSAILEVIFEKLSLINCITVSDVCKAWRSVVAREICGWERRGVPWLMMSGQKERQEWTCRSILILQQKKWKMVLPQARGRYCWGSHDWLFLVNVSWCFRFQITLFNPFSRKKIDLPETGDFYCKMFLSGHPSFGHFICMLVDSACRELAFWAPKAQSWLKLKLDGERFLDAVFSKGSFYLVSNDYNILDIRATDIFAAIRTDNVDAIKTHPYEVEMLEEQEQNHDNMLMYLVESCGEILFVCRFYKPKTDAICETHDFKVYSLDLSKKSWKRVHDLGDQILFLGKSCSRSFSSRELGARVKNCIYFSNNDVDPYWNEWDSDSVYGKSSIVVQSNPERKDWGVFRLTRNQNDERFHFRGNLYCWGPVWFTAPQWWCCRKDSEPWLTIG